MAATMPWIRSKFTDQNNKPLVGGKLWSYQAGTNTPVASYTDSSGLVANTNPVILDGNGEADIYLKPGNYKLVLMNKNDVVLWTRDQIKPNDGGGGGIVDADYTTDAFSLRFNEQFTATGLLDWLNKIIKPGYAAPTISLGSNVGTGPIEKGYEIPSITFNASITRKSNPIAQVRFYKGASLLNTQSSGGAIPNGGTSTYEWSGSFTDTTTFSAQVDDSSGDTGGPTTVTSNRTFNYVYAYYAGVGIANLNAISLVSLTKVVDTPSASQSRAYTMAIGQKPYFCYPNTLPALTSIKNASNLETIESWTQRSVSLTNTYGQSATYRVYEFNNLAGEANSNTYTFIR